MGNILSVSFPWDQIFKSGCWDSLSRRADYVRKLPQNLADLNSSFQKLRALKSDVMRKVEVAELQPLVKRLDKVELWIKSVQKVETRVTQLLDRDQEIEKLCCGGCCSQTYVSSYKYGKEVANKLKEVDALTKEGEDRFESGEVASKSLDAAALVRERPAEPTVGMEFMFDKVRRHVEDEDVGVIGLYGMGGVGKTTLLTQIYNNLLKTPHGFNLVIWILVSKDHKIESIQDKIGEKIGRSGDSWKHKAQDEKAQDILGDFSSKKFVLFLDDIWEQVDITKLGVPFPDNQNKSKIIFTTRSKEVCFQMKAQEMIKVECLQWKKAWELFEQNVGGDTILIHPQIKQLSETVAKECGGLPLALITVGKAMAGKTTPERWRRAIQVLQKSASEFSGMDKVFSLLKFSYDSLPNEKVRSCFLYCAVFPEDYFIPKEDLVHYWMCEEILDEFISVDEAKDQSYDIIGTLLDACLLKDEGERVRMHDVIREMALWLACDCGKEDSSILVHTGSQEVTNVEKWKNAKRVSFVYSDIKCLVETPKSPNLLTLLIRLKYSFDLNMIRDGFFDYMGGLQVLDLHGNRRLTRLPSGVSKLVSLQHLNLSGTGIRELPIELKDCVRLRYLNLEFTFELEYVPPDLISSFKKLKVLKMRRCGKSEDAIVFGNGSKVREGESNGMMVIEEIEGLKELECLSLTICTFSSFQIWLNYPKSVTKCMELLELYCITESQNSMMMDQRTRLRCLRSVFVSSCPELKDLTWLIFAPNLDYLKASACLEMEKIIDLEKLSGVEDVVQQGSPFGKLRTLYLQYLPKLKSIYESALPFPYLDKITVLACPALKKLPLKFNSSIIAPQTQTCNNLEINGEEWWWNALEWEDQAASNFFLPCFSEWLSGAFEW